MSGTETHLRGEVLTYADWRGWLTNVGPVDVEGTVFHVMVHGKRRLVAMGDLLPWLLGVAEDRGEVDQLLATFPDLEKIITAAPARQHT